MSDLTACDIETALLQTQDSTEGDGTAGGLLRELLDYVLNECECDDGSDAADVLAAKGSGWERHFGVRVRNDGTDVHVLWGRGDGYTWCPLQDVLDACAVAGAPDWWDSDWTEVEHPDTGEWVQRDVLRAQQEAALDAEEADLES